MLLKRSIRCPNCSGPLIPAELRCEACDLAVRGRFAGNEFSSLGEEDLHFLRIFVLCEGRIRDMESALGVSYPTIKTRLAKLKGTLAAQTLATPLQATSAGATAAAIPGERATNESLAAQVLDDLSQGRLGYPEALEKLRRLTREDG